MCLRVSYAKKIKKKINFFASLKGQCHEMNNFFGALKNQISTFCIGADGCKIFLHLQCLEKYFLSSCLLL
jgi:hypothetical protein